MIGRRALAQLALLLSAGRCSRWDDGISIQGAGASFPYPLYTKWIYEFHRDNPSVFINYQSIGSGGGMRQILTGTVDFAATDVPMTDEELREALSPLVQVPMALGAVAVGYNAPGAAPALRFTPELLVDIFLGKVTRWRDPVLLAQNPGVEVEDLPLSVVYRTDGSGTSAIYSDFLAAASPAWQSQIGSGRYVRWPVGLGAKGNEGVAQQVRSVPGAIGYLEVAYATQAGLKSALIRNRAGRFVGPAVASMTAAARAVSMPAALHVSLVRAPAEDAYPLSAYTYLLACRDSSDPRKGEALARFLWWALHEGQRYTTPLGYAPLPSTVVPEVESALLTLSVAHRPILHRD